MPKLKADVRLNKKTGEITNHYELPYDSMDLKQSESSAICMLHTANEQLEHVGSDYRLGVFNKDTGKRCGVKLKYAAAEGTGE